MALAALTVVAVAVAFAVAPAFTQSAYAKAPPKTTVTEETRCDDPRFADRESCPGASEDSQGQAGDTRDDETTVTCEARNPGQAKNCPPGSTIVFV